MRAYALSLLGASSVTCVFEFVCVCMLDNGSFVHQVGPTHCDVNICFMLFRPGFFRIFIFSFVDRLARPLLGFNCAVVSFFTLDLNIMRRTRTSTK